MLDWRCGVPCVMMRTEGVKNVKDSATQALIEIRTYQPGDEVGQVAIYNDATRALPGFKVATTDEVLKRYRASNFDPRSKLYAFQDRQMVGYASYSDNGRVSVPWCRPEAVDAGPPLMNSVLQAVRERGLKQAWAAYRDDWENVNRQLMSYGFRRTREIVNFMANLANLPSEPSQPFTIERLQREDVADAYELDPAAFEVTSADELAEAWMEGPYISNESQFVLRNGEGRIAGVALAIVNPQYADPSKIDSAMPCFRLGALRTESERTKRVNGLFSYVAHPGAENHALGRKLLAEARRRFETAGLSRAAAQCPSDRPTELAFYRAHFQPQKSFPIFVREL
jgi:GNAT superfamily N-acetyltransferase